MIFIKIICGNMMNTYQILDFAMIEMYLVGVELEQLLQIMLDTIDW